jgi:hypothetical protein
MSIKFDEWILDVLGFWLSCLVFPWQAVVVVFDLDPVNPTIRKAVLRRIIDPAKKWLLV